MNLMTEGLEPLNSLGDEGLVIGPQITFPPFKYFVCFYNILVFIFINKVKHFPRLDWIRDPHTMKLLWNEGLLARMLS